MPPAEKGAWIDRIRQRVADKIAPPERCACGTRLIVCECGDDRCPKCDPDGCPGG